MRPVIVSLCGLASDQQWTHRLACSRLDPAPTLESWQTCLDWIEMCPGRLDMRVAGDRALGLSLTLRGRTVAYLGLQTALLHECSTGEGLRWHDEQAWFYLPNELFSAAWYAWGGHREAAAMRLADMWDQLADRQEEMFSC